MSQTDQDEMANAGAMDTAAVRPAGDNADGPCRVVIIGGGFAGVRCARRLARDRAVRVTLINESNHMVFQPLLADVAGSALNPRAVAAPLRQMLDDVRCLSETVESVDTDKRQVNYRDHRGEARRLDYDHLVIAVGSRVNLSMISGMSAHALPLKTIADAIAMRAAVMERLEQAEVVEEDEERRHLLSFAVVGGGFSGVEVAGEINDLIRSSLRFYPGLDADQVCVTVIHAEQEILPELPPELGRFARERMCRAGVRFRLSARAGAVTPNGVHLEDGEKVAAATVVCTIGNAPCALVQQLPFDLERGRIPVAEDLGVAGQKGVWAVGDCALAVNQHTGEVAPPTAQIAESQGEQVADNILRTLRAEATRAFRHKPAGALAGIGSRSGVGQIYGVRVSGLLAWWLWRSTYLIKLPSLVQKLKVGLEWAWEMVFPRDINFFQPARSLPVKPVFFRQDELVLEPGCAADQFYIVKCGQCVLEEAREGTSARRLLVIGPGEIIGRPTLESYGDSDALHIRALEDMELVRVSEDFLSNVSTLLKPVQSAIRRAIVRNQDDDAAPQSQQPGQAADR